MCTDNQNTQLTAPENLKYLFQAIYSEDFIMGNSELVVKFQNLLKDCQEKKLDNLSSYFTDDVVWSLPDGNRYLRFSGAVNWVFWLYVHKIKIAANNIRVKIFIV